MSSFVKYRGANIHFTVQGKGETIVLLHGFLESSTMWKNLLPLLNEYRTVCIDLPGHGKSESFGYVHTMEEMANAVKEVIDFLELNQFIFAGHSMGGYVVLSFAKRFEKYVKGIGLLNSSPLADSEEKKRNRDRAISAVKENQQKFVALSIPNLFSLENRDLYRREIDEIIDEARLMEARGIVSSLEGMKRRDERLDILDRFKERLFMIIGKDDPVLNSEEQENLAIKYDNHWKILDGGHMSYIESFEDFSYFFMHFIEKL